MRRALKNALIVVSAVALIALAGVWLYRYFIDSRIRDDRKPDSDSYDETDSEIRVIWRTDDGDETQKLSGSHAEALEALVLGIAEEAYAASKLETEHL